MAVASNDFAQVPEGMDMTGQAAQFLETPRYEDIPAEALHIGRRCILDAMGLYAAGSEEHSVHILIDEARDTGGRGDAQLLGAGGGCGCRSAWLPGCWAPPVMSMTGTTPRSRTTPRMSTAC